MRTVSGRRIPPGLKITKIIETLGSSFDLRLCLESSRAGAAACSRFRPDTGGGASAVLSRQAGIWEKVQLVDLPGSTRSL